MSIRAVRSGTVASVLMHQYITSIPFRAARASSNRHSRNSGRIGFRHLVDKGGLVGHVDNGYKTNCFSATKLSACLAIWAYCQGLIVTDRLQCIPSGLR